MKITVHRGTKEIGGSVVEIESKGCRIVIDIGMPLAFNDRKFDFSDYSHLDGKELVNQQILPDIKGLYHWDENHKPVDGVLISHAHQDHYGFFDYLNRDIPVYLGEATKNLMDITVLLTPLEGEVGKPQYIADNNSFTCGEFCITPYLMDHAAFDAYAFLVEAEGKRIIYTGDFRAHGRKKGMFNRFLHAHREPDALLLEGTMMGRPGEHVMDEEELEEEAVKIMENTGGPVLIYTSSQNIDRLVSFYRASKRTGRTFVIDLYTALILDYVRGYTKIPYPSHEYDKLKVFYPMWLCQKLASKNQQKLMFKYKKHKIDKNEIRSKGKNISMLVRPSFKPDLKAIGNLNEASLIYSMWEGYLEEEVNQKFLDYLESENVKDIYHLHTSGHACVSDLKLLVKKLCPQRVIPIHTFHPTGYESLGGNICYLDDGKPFNI